MVFDHAGDADLTQDSCLLLADYYGMSKVKEVEGAQKPVAAF